MFFVGDELLVLGYIDMFVDVFDVLESGRELMEMFYDGYVVNLIVDVVYRLVESKWWELIEFLIWCGEEGVL